MFKPFSTIHRSITVFARSLSSICQIERERMLNELVANSKSFKQETDPKKKQALSKRNAEINRMLVEAHFKPSTIERILQARPQD
jgi:hypothetical protein